MRDYGKVSPQFWIGKTGKDLRGQPEAQVVALYLMTSPHSTMVGVYHLPKLYLAHETGLTMEGACKGLARCIEIGFCAYDEDTETVFVVEMAAHQVGDTLKSGDLRAKGIEKQYSAIAVPEIKAAFFARYGEAFSLPSPLEGASKGASKPHSPAPAPSSKKKKESREVTLAAWLDQLEGDAVPADDPIFDWANKQGIPRDWIALAWYAMEDKYQDRDKTYIDWRAAFRTEVRNGWLDVWRHDARAGSYVLTLKGEQLRRESQA